MGPCWAHGSVYALSDRIPTARGGRGVDIRPPAQHLLIYGEVESSHDSPLFTFLFNAGDRVHEEMCICIDLHSCCLTVFVVCTVTLSITLVGWFWQLCKVVLRHWLNHGVHGPLHLRFSIRSSSFGECSALNSSWCSVCACRSDYNPQLVEDLHKLARIHSHSTPSRPCQLRSRTTPTRSSWKSFCDWSNAEYAGFLDPREQYVLAATESGMWRVFVLRQEEEQLVEARYWEMVEEGWFSD